MKRRARPLARRLLDSVGVNGLIAIALVTTAVVISYSAQNGVPFVPTYDIRVDIPEAAQLTKNSDVRIGGTRIGQVLRIQGMPPARGRPPYARLWLSLSTSVEPLPADTTVRMRLGSLLGGKYIELTPGRSRRTIPPGGLLDLSHARSLVELDDAFQLFDQRTGQALRDTINGYGNAFAARGASVNEAVGAIGHLLPPLEDVLRVLGDPSTRLARLVRTTATATATLRPVAPQLAGLFDNGGRTLQAVDAAGGALGSAVEQLPGTEQTGTLALRHLTPVLADAAALAHALRPAGPLLPPTTRALDRIVRIATPVVRRAPAAAPPLERTLAAAQAYGTDPATIGTFQVLGSNDLGSFGGSMFLGLGAILRVAAPAQLYCNAISVWIRNLSSTASEGDASGTWIRMAPVVDNNLSLQSAAPAPELHYNPYPNENAHECEAGNEPYLPGQVIGNPPGDQSRATDHTSDTAVGGR